MENQSSKEELDRIHNVYAGYQASGRSKYRWGTGVGNEFLWETRMGTFRKILRRYGIQRLDGLKILDVGCGSGDVLCALAALGATPQDLFGVDILSDKIESARKRDPEIHWDIKNGETLDFSDGFFDLVLQSTVFSSILDDGMLTRMAKEMRRVHKKTGLIISYDVRCKNPWNPHIRPMGKHLLRKLFPGNRIEFYSCTLLPGIARKVAWLPILCKLLEALPVLRVHYYAVIHA